MVEIADLAPGEVEAAVALWRAAGLTRPWNDPRADAALALASPSSTVLAGRLDGSLVATVMVGFDGHRAWAYYLAVAGAHRRRGLGAAMLRAAERWAADRGAPKLHLTVRSGNDPALGFDDACGYARSEVVVLQRALGRGGGV